MTSTAPQPSDSRDHDIAAELADAMRYFLEHYMVLQKGNKGAAHKPDRDSVVIRARAAIAAFEESRK